MIKTVNHQRTLRATIVPPGDKSIGHRAVIFNSLAEGKARLSHFCSGRDCMATVACMRALGAKIAASRSEPDIIDMEGVGMSGLHEPADILNARNSGTTTRLLSGLLAAQDFLSVITGDASLRSRPMARVVSPLREMGADIVGRSGGKFAPLVVIGRPLTGITYVLPVPSAQVKSAILIAGLFARGQTTVVDPALSRDHTERMLSQMGAPLVRDGLRTTVSRPVQPLRPLSFYLPGDISAAAYWLVAGAIHPDAVVHIKNCGVNPTRTGIIDILTAMGANIKVEPRNTVGPEPVADLTVRSSDLSGIEVGGELIVRSIDEVPVLAVAACMARGTTVIRGAAELRVKETDRILHTSNELRRLGADVKELPDGMVIKGNTALKGAGVHSHGDHRLAMSLAIAGLVARGDTTVSGAEAASVSYPSFWADLEQAAVRRKTG